MHKLAVILLTVPMITFLVFMAMREEAVANEYDRLIKRMRNGTEV